MARLRAGSPGGSGKPGLGTRELSSGSGSGTPPRRWGIAALGWHATSQGTRGLDDRHSTPGLETIAADDPAFLPPPGPMEATRLVRLALDLPAGAQRTERGQQLRRPRLHDGHLRAPAEPVRVLCRALPGSLRRLDGHDGLQPLLGGTASAALA